MKRHCLFSILLFLLLFLDNIACITTVENKKEEANPLTNAQCLRDSNTGLLLPAHVIIGDNVLDNYMIGSLKEALFGRLKITVASHGRYVQDGVDIYTPGETIAIVINMYWTGSKSDVTGLFRAPLDTVKRQVNKEMSQVLAYVFKAFEDGLPNKVHSKDKIIFAYDRTTESIYLHVASKGDDSPVLDMSHKVIFNKCDDYPLTAAMASQMNLPGSNIRSLNVCSAMTHVILNVLDRMKGG